MRGRFWLRPKWVAGHLLCLFLIVLFVNLGFWQLRRLDEKRDRNSLIHSRERAAPTAVVDALRDGPADAVYRRVRDRGRWVIDETVLVRSRALNEQPGYDVVTPLVLPGGSTILVNRGFAAEGGGGEAAILRAARPKRVDVEVSGILRQSETRGRFGPTDATGREQVVNRVDVARLQRQVDEKLVPVFLQLRSSKPAPGDIPVPRPLPATDEGPHLSYAVQWFIFATVGAIGWPLLLRKTARDEARESSDEDDGEA